MMRARLAAWSFFSAWMRVLLNVSIVIAIAQFMNDIPLDLVNKVQLDARSRQLVDLRSVLIILFEELRVGIAVIVKNINDTVVVKAALQRRLDHFGIPGSANVHFAPETRLVEQTRIHAAQLMISMQRTHPVVILAAIEVFRWWISHRWIQTVEMPMLAAKVAWYEHASAFG